MKRGSSGLCLIVGIDKPTGATSHHVVNECRRIFDERRVGHTGTLDPLASGVLPVCIGPATRLSQFLTAHDKRYTVSVVFGTGTDTDDAEGRVVKTAPVPDKVRDVRFAQSFVSSLVGTSKQLPPVYSAVKVEGHKACDEARNGRIVDLKPRDIEVYAADLLGVSSGEDADDVTWDIDFHVSKGTYIRSLARDIGNELGCPAHVGALRRTQVGALGLDECVSLEVLAALGAGAALDPLRLLDMRFAYADGDVERAVAHGGTIPGDSPTLFDRWRTSGIDELSSCTSGVRESGEPARDGEHVAIVVRNALAAIYTFDADARCYRACRIFPVGVSRGCDIQAG